MRCVWALARGLMIELRRGGDAGRMRGLLSGREGGTDSLRGKFNRQN